MSCFPRMKEISRREVVEQRWRGATVGAAWVCYPLCARLPLRTTQLEGCVGHIISFTCSPTITPDMVVQIRLWHALPPASARQARDSHAHAESTRVLSAARSKAFVGGSIPIAHRKRTLPARSHAISASAAVPVASRLWHVAAAAAQPTTEALLMQNVRASSTPAPGRTWPLCPAV